MRRRGFLGALLAAPVAAPAVIKEAVGSAIPFPPPGLYSSNYEGSVSEAFKMVSANWRESHESILSTLAKRKFLSTAVPDVLREMLTDNNRDYENIVQGVNALRSISTVNRHRIIQERQAKLSMDNWINAPVKAMKNHMFKQEHPDAHMASDWDY